MKSCKPFRVTFNQKPEQLISRAKVFSEHNGGVFEGDTISGNFSALVMGMSRFAGMYLIDEQTMIVTITEKPRLLSCALIEKTVKEKLQAE